MIDEDTFLLYRHEVEKYVAPLNSEGLFDSILNNDAFESNKIFLCYPYLFGTALDLPAKHPAIKSIAVAGYLYFYSLLKIDDLFDAASETMGAKVMMFILKSHEEAIKILSQYFNIECPFWQNWNRLHDTYYHNIVQEKKLRQQKAISKYKYDQIAIRRNAVGLVALEAVRHLKKNTNDSRYLALTRIHNNFAIAYQMLDDIKDIKTDYKTGQINFNILKFINNKNAASEITIERKIKYFYLSGMYKQTYRRILNKIDLAIDTANYVEAAAWSVSLGTFKKMVADELYNMNGFINCVKARDILTRRKGKPVLPYQKLLKASAVFSGLQPVEKATLRFLFKQIAQGFGELKHVIFLNKNIGLSSGKDVHINDTFQRAIIGDVLCDCKDVLGVHLDTVLKNETLYLLGKRQKDIVGGWSYYPGIKEIAADADDLGQILQFFVRTNQIGLIERHILPPLQILLLDRMHTDGGIETWIIPALSSDAFHIRQQKYNAMWGAGPDNEVMANLLYGLCLFDFQKYQKEIIRSSKYLISKQEKNGSWQSKWYYGPYYGTMVVARLLVFLTCRGQLVAAMLT